MVEKHDDVKYFRWNDSGDLQSVKHLENLAEVARRMPRLKFWLPTREYKIVEDWIGNGGIRPKNLIIRLSAHIIDGPLPLALAKRLKVLVSGVHRKGSKVAKGVWVCEAKERGGLCGPCRRCWDSRIKAVSYPLH